MNNKYIWIFVSVIVLIVFIYLIYKSTKNNTVVIPVSNPKGSSAITALGGITNVNGSGIESNSSPERTIVLLKGRNI